MYQENTAHHSPAPPVANLLPPGQQDPEADGRRLIIESRFGALAISPQNAVEFPKGLLGFADLHCFALADLNDTRFPQLKVLQSLDNEEMSFLTLPVDPENGIIEPADLKEACKNLDFSFGDLALLLVVAVRRMNNEVVITANLRAPLLIDSETRKAAQYVLSNSRYPVRLPL